MKECLFLPPCFLSSFAPSRFTADHPFEQQFLQSILLTLAALSETSDAYRRAVSSQQPLLMNLAITSIASPFAPLRLAGLKTLRRLSRSTNVLRTTLVNPKMGPGGKSFVEVLIALTIADKGPDAEPDEEKVTEEALGLLANLLLEFSPLRGVGPSFSVLTLLVIRGERN